MNKETLKRLEAAGFAPTTVAESLGLTPAEEALVELKVQFTTLLKQTRLERGLTQAQLAKELETTQQTVARAESGTSVTLDFLFRALVTQELSLADLGDELHALHAALHPDAAHVAAASACARAQAGSQTGVGIKPLDKQELIAPEKSSVGQPIGPALKLLRGGFRGTPVRPTTRAAVQSWRPLVDTEEPLLLQTG